jgi:hypothetical protein
MLRWIRKRLALRAYRRRLGPALVRKYGKRTTYSIDQVRETAAAERLNLDYVCYGYAAFCSSDTFSSHHEAIKQVCDWQAMREEIGWWYADPAEHFDHGHRHDQVGGWGGYDTHHAHAHDPHDTQHHHDAHHHDSGSGFDGGGHHDGGSGFDGGGHHH